MTPNYLGILKADFKLLCVSDVHVGDGSKGNFSGDPTHEVAGIEYDRFARGDFIEPGTQHLVERPCIPSTSLKGAVRRVATDVDENLAKLLLGSEPKDAVNSGDGEQPSKTGTGGLLIPYASELSNPSRGNLPKSDAKGDADTFIRVRNAGSRRTGGTVDELLYAREWVSAGSTFSGRFGLASLRFEDETRRREIAEAIACLLGALSHPDGFSLGASRTTAGLVRFEWNQLNFLGKVLQKTVRTEAGKKIVSVKDDMAFWQLNAAEFNPVPARKFALSIPGPMSFLDPFRSSIEDQAVGKDRNNELQTYQRSSSGDPIGLAEAVRQSLRRESLKLELRDLFLDEEKQEKLKTYEELETEEFLELAPTNELRRDLLITQRLFGIADWGGVVSVHVNDITAESTFRHAIVKLDVVTHRNDGLAFINGPAGVSCEVRIKVDEARLKALMPGADAKLDLAHFESLLERCRKKKLRIGHAIGSGFGMTDLTEIEVQPEAEDIS